MPDPLSQKIESLLNKGYTVIFAPPTKSESCWSVKAVMSNGRSMIAMQKLLESKDAAVRAAI